MKTDRARRQLFKATAARCRGRTLVLARSGRLVAQALSERGLSAMHVDLPSLNAPTATLTLPKSALAGEDFNTILVTDLLEHVSEEVDADLISHAWQLLKPGGRLVVSVPNGDCTRLGDNARRFNRRRLKKLLRPLGKPRLATDQPFKWLTMYLDKPREGRRPQNRTRRERYRVTAKLCHGTVIELGCGEGHLAKAIADRGLEVLAVDISHEKIRSARDQYPEITFIRSDIRALSLAEETFDTVVLAEVLEHVTEDPGAEILAKAWRFLRPGGRLIVSVPNENCIPHRNHVRQFDRRSLKNLLKPLGKPELVSDQPFKWLMMYLEKAV